jgi:predicted ribosome quality control (RQC) complex YloA/Tae2 family protein
VYHPGVASKGRGYRSLTIDGFEVLVGRGARENDRLTFGVAEPHDFWLHVAGGTAGSHVVVRNPDGLAELPREVLRRAAQLAAWHSKARVAGGKVEVHVCRAADVSKRRGAPAGEVVLRRWDSVRVYAQVSGDGAGEQQ